MAPLLHALRRERGAIEEETATFRGQGALMIDLAEEVDLCFGLSGVASFFVCRHFFPFE
jgi:hypothetical protein